MDDVRFAAFAADVAARGVVVPVDITSSGVILDGRERYRAAQAAGLAELPVRVVDVSDEVAYMLLAALQRRDLEPSQRAALQLELLDYEQERDQRRTRSRSNLRNAPVEVATLPPRAGLLRDQLAAAASVSARTAQDVLTVREHDRELFDAVKAGMPAHRAARTIRRRQRHAEIGEAAAMPDGPFDLIYADPPWQMGNPGSDYAPEQYYPTMPLDDIKNLEVPSSENAVLYLWAVNSLLPEAIEVIIAWGFIYRANVAWVKQGPKLGVYFRNRHELLLFARKGNYPVPEPTDRAESVLFAPAGRHSAKPDEAYDLIETSYPEASKLELFRRGTPRPGWAAWGNQVTS